MLTEQTKQKQSCYYKHENCDCGQITFESTANTGGFKVLTVVRPITMHMKVPK